MYKHLSTVVLLVATLSLSACNQTREDRQNMVATGHSFDELKSPEDGKALLYLMRESNAYREYQFPTVKLNGKPVIELKDGGYSYIQLPPGTYQVSNEPSNWATSTSIHLKEGEVYFLELAVKTIDTPGHLEHGLASLGGVVGGMAIANMEVRAEREWVLNEKANALFNLQHYRYVPLLSK